MVTQQDLMVINDAVNIFLASRNGATRNAMVGAVSKVLEKTGERKISLLHYSVERGKYGGVRFIPRHYTDGRHCPRCGLSLYGDTCTIVTIIEGDNGDIVTYGCGCGEIVGKWEEK